MIKYSSFNLKQMSPDIRRKLKRLTFELGTMRDYLDKRQLNWFDDVNVTMAVDMKAKKIVGWSTVDKFWDTPGLYDLNIFVDPMYRRLGIATSLIQKQLKHDKNIKRFKVSTHDKTSNDVYARLGGHRDDGQPLKISKSTTDNDYGAGDAYDAFIDKSKFISKSPKLTGQKIKNPETGNDILVKTALKYDKNHPAYKAAVEKLK